MKLTNALIGALAIAVFAVMVSVAVLATLGFVREMLHRTRLVREPSTNGESLYTEKYFRELAKCFTPFSVKRLVGLLFYRPRASMGFMVLLLPLGFALLTAAATLLSVFNR